MHYCILCSYRSSLFLENRRRFLSQLVSTGSLIFEKISRGLFGIVVLPFSNLTPGLLLWLVLAPSSQAPPLVAVAVSTVMAADSSHAASHSPQRFGPWYLLTSYAVSVRHPHVCSGFFQTNCCGHLCRRLLAILAGISSGRYSHRGLSTCKFAPMMDAHPPLQRPLNFNHEHHEKTTPRLHCR